MRNKKLNKNYYNIHKIEILKKAKEYYNNHIEERKAYNKEWRKNNNEKTKEYKRQWFLKNKKKRKKYLNENKEKLKKQCRIHYNNVVKFRKYNITKEQYELIFNKQNGCCKICNISQSKLKTALAVDHNHETGEVRGLLCMKCNRGIGYLNDNVTLLTKAIYYLKNN